MKASSEPAASDPRDLYMACYSRLVGLVTLVAGSHADAEDAVQEAFARLVPRWHKVSRYDDPEAWVRKVAFRLLSNRRRQARNHLKALVRLRSVDATPGPSPVPVDVARAIASLPVGQRQVVVLHHMLDLSLQDIADELGMPLGTVKSRLLRARNALASLLHEEINYHA